MRAIWQALGAAGLWLALSHAGAADLSVSVTGVRSEQGTVRIAVYDRPEGFRQEDKALHRLALPAKNGQVQASFTRLSPGRYAVMVYHDEDNNGRLNLRFGMIPQEGYGLSNAPQVVGPPQFADAAFDLPAQGASIVVPLNY